MLGLALMPVLSGGRLSAQGQGQPSIGLNGDGTSRVVPHPASAVEIRSTKRGVLLPRLTAGQRHILRVEPSTAGLTVYQTDSVAGLYVWDGTVWQYLNPGLVLSDEDGQLRFATVAVTGSYNDLTGRPVLPTTPDGDGFAKVAYTGDYYDLIDLPEIPKSLQGLRLVAITGEYKDLDRRPAIPERTADLKTDEFYRLVSDADRRRWDSASQRVILSRLRELAQDSLHRTVTQEEIERWQTAAARSIPSTLSDMKTDDYYKTVTLAEKEAWNRHAATPVPKALYDLKSDEYAQTVSDGDIARYEAASARYIPTMLRELDEDSLHRTITTRQMERWTSHADAMFFSGNYADLKDLPEIPRHLSQFTDDALHKIISYKERELWDSAYRRPVPTRLSELKDDNMQYRLISDAERTRWDSMVVREIPEYEDIDPNAFILHGDPTYMDGYRPLSDFGRQGMWSMLIGAPTFSPNTAPVTGNYNDLSAVGLPKLLAVESGFLDNLSYNSLLYDKPDLHSEFIKDGNSRHIGDKPEGLSDFTEDAGAVHVSSSEYNTYNTAREKLLITGVPSPTGYSLNEVYGTYTNLKLADNLTLEGTPTVAGSFPDGRTMWNSTAYDNYVATVGAATALDRYAANVATDTECPIPEGAVMMWHDANSLPNGGKSDRFGGCWKEYEALKGRFPMGKNPMVYPPQPSTGGAETVTLTIDQIPSHKHDFFYKKEKRTKDADDTDMRVFKNDNIDTYNSHEDGLIGYNSHPGTGDATSYDSYATVAHNNLPPYYVIRFIEYTKSNCPAN